MSRVTGGANASVSSCVMRFAVLLQDGRHCARSGGEHDVSFGGDGMTVGIEGHVADLIEAVRVATGDARVTISRVAGGVHSSVSPPFWHRPFRRCLSEAGHRFSLRFDGLS